VVSEIHLNDADRRVYSFWKSALHSSERFADLIREVPLTIEEWHRQHDICVNPTAHSQFDIGFSAFFMNRCNRSGVLTGSGPIGGFEQSGKWRIDVRFNRPALAERILLLSKMRKRIHVTNHDAIDFLKASLPRGRGRDRVFVYLDPPYVIKGQRLYLNAYQPADHAILSQYMSNQRTLKWIMSYDDNQLVRSLYARNRLFELPIRYTLQEKRSAQELIIAPKHLYLPKSCKSYGQEFILKAAI
jgi:DNA adenine methylase